MGKRHRQSEEKERPGLPKKNVEQELVDGAVLQSQLKINVSGPELWTRVQVLKQSVHTDKSVLAAVMIFIQVLFLEKKKTRE